MNTAKITAALNTLSLGIAELAEALSEGTAPAVAPHSANPDAPRTFGQQIAARSGLPADIDARVDAISEPDYEQLPFTSDQVESSALGRCPAHDRPWTVKEAGVSKAGKSYNAFFKCDARDGDVFCPRKPVKAWADAHAAQLA